MVHSFHVSIGHKLMMCCRSCKDIPRTAWWKSWQITCSSNLKSLAGRTLAREAPLLRLFFYFINLQLHISTSIRWSIAWRYGVNKSRLEACTLYPIQVKHWLMSTNSILSYQAKHLEVTLNENKSRAEFGKQSGLRRWTVTDSNIWRKIHLRSHFSSRSELLEQIRLHWCWKSDTLQPWSPVNKSLWTIGKRACWTPTILKPSEFVQNKSHLCCFQPKFQLQSITQQVLFGNGADVHKL